jgi:plastocyanin
VPADTPFTIEFKNEDAAGVPHDVDVRKTDKTTVVQDQEIINGGATATYSYLGLPAGDYVFICSIHPQLMTGTISAR